MWGTGWLDYGPEGLIRSMPDLCIRSNETDSEEEILPNRNRKFSNFQQQIMAGNQRDQKKIWEWREDAEPASDYAKTQGNRVVA